MDTLELLIILVLEAVQLVMLQKDALLDHGLVRFREKVILLDVMVLVRSDDLSHVALQVVTLPSLAGLVCLLLLLLLCLLLLLLQDELLLLLLRGAAVATRYLLLVHARELLGRALLH